MKPEIEDLFLRPAEPSSDIPRPTMCRDCAFRSAPSVRPAGITIADLEITTCCYDDFVCHHQGDDGLYPSCAGWHARFGHGE